MRSVWWAGHLRTVLPRLRSWVAAEAAPPSRPWRLPLEDPKLGRVWLSGRLGEVSGARDALVVVHGLGGSSASPYAVAMARAARRAGLATLRLDMRGSDRRGEDFYHAGLSDDLHAALASPELAPYDTLYLLGYSLGGHLALKAATERPDPRLAAVAAVCAPLLLAPCAAAFDSSRRWPYRRYLLAHLQAIYRRVAERRPVPLPANAARRIRHIREWDERIVAPRFGFAGAGDYYERTSVGPRLDRLRVPALLLAATADPMVPVEAVRPALDGVGGLEVHWADEAGHVGFPPGLTLDGVEAPPGLEAQLLAWLDRAARRRGGR